MGAEPGRRFLKQLAAKLEPVIVVSEDMSQFLFVKPHRFNHIFKAIKMF